MSRVLVLGGSGWVGSAVVRALTAAGEDVASTWHRREGIGRTWRVDLREPDAVAGLFARMDADGWVPDAVVHAAGVRVSGTVAAYADEDLTVAMRVHVGVTIAVCKELARRPAPGVRNVVIFGALDRTQSFPMPAAFAAVQGGLTATAMALGHELGPQGFRVNVVALGLLDGGAAQDVSPAQAEAYTRFSALRRIGTAEEAAATAVWLVRGNTAINGRCIPASGGL